MMNIGSLGAQGSVANGINFDRRTKTFTQIAGWSPTSDNSSVHAVIWDASLQITDLGTLGGPSSFGAFVWTATGGMKDLNTLIPSNSGWDLQVAKAISDNGRIVGEGTINGAGHVYLLVPVK